ncbi:MAG: hypothetical protein M3N21_05685 [Actinomycetota bacterium]|nr:hypothetical protein [Actinomycetota bacterium]
MSAADALFDLPEGIPPSLATVSRDRRRTAAQHRAVAQGIHPLTRTRTRPELGTCGQCAFLVSVGHNSRRYLKCAFGIDPATTPIFMAPRITRGAGTDVRAFWPACSDFVARPNEGKG